MKFTRFTKIMVPGAAAGFTLLAVSLITGAIPAAAADRENGQLHIVKDCGAFTGVPGSSYCTVITSNLAELPPGTRIYYDQITAGPSAGASGYLDSNVFLFVIDGQWAVGRCTVVNKDNPPVPSGICTLSDGFGPLAGITARVTVTKISGRDGALYAWDGTYSFKSLPDK
jgi:hypothetical protein